MKTGSLPQAIGPYEIQGIIGSGGMATVYRAYHPQDQRHVALKVLALHLADQEEVRHRFAREARMLQTFHHPHILPVYDFGEDGGTLYLAMMLLSGNTLGNRLKDHKPMPGTQVSRITRQIASALDYAHARHIIHRDVKPSNILLSDADQPYLADFGIARNTDTSTHLTADGRFLGTVSYASPEQCRGEQLTASSDLYSLAVVVFRMLSGRAPFEGPSPLAVIKQHMNDIPPNPIAFNPDLPLALYAVLSRALAKLPANRYPSALHFSDALDNALGLASIEVMREDDAWLHPDMEPPTPATDPPADLTEAVLLLPGDTPDNIDEYGDIVFTDAFDDTFDDDFETIEDPPVEEEAAAPPPGELQPLVAKPAPSRAAWEQIGVYATIVISLISLAAAVVIAYSQFHEPGLEFGSTYRSSPLGIALRYPDGWFAALGSFSSLTNAAAPVVIVADQPVPPDGPYTNAALVLAVQIIDPIQVFGVPLSCQTRIPTGPQPTFDCMAHQNYATPVYERFDTDPYPGVRLPGTLPPILASMPIVLLAPGDGTWIAVSIVHWNRYENARSVLDQTARSIRPLN